MSTTTTTDDIRAQLDQARVDLRDAEALVGAAQLEGNPTGPAQKQLAKTRDTVSALEAAIDVAEQRDRDTAEQAAAEEWRDRRRGFYAWAAEYLDAAEEFIQAHEAAAASRDRLAAIGSPPRPFAAVRAGTAIAWQPYMPCEDFSHRDAQGRPVSRLIHDPEMIGADPIVFDATKVQVNPSHGHEHAYRPLKGLTVERIEQVRARLAEVLAMVDDDTDLGTFRDQIAQRHQDSGTGLAKIRARRQAHDQAMRDHYARKAEEQRQAEEREEQRRLQERTERRSERMAA